MFYFSRKVKNRFAWPILKLASEICCLFRSCRSSAVYQPHNKLVPNNKPQYPKVFLETTKSKTVRFRSCVLIRCVN